MELVGTTAKGASIYVDFAHTPDGIENALKSLRHHSEGKLGLFSAAAATATRPNARRWAPWPGSLPTKIIVTDDNPRFEDPAEIRKQIMAAVPEAVKSAAAAKQLNMPWTTRQKATLFCWPAKDTKKVRLCREKFCLSTTGKKC